MSRPRDLGSAFQVENDFVEADLDTAFALLYAAEMQSLSGDHANALRAIEEAGKAVVDGQRRLPGLNVCDRERLSVQLKRVRDVIERIRLNLK